MVPSPAYARATMCDPERARSAASGPPRDEVGDLNPGRRVAGLPQRERTGQVPRHPVVAEGGDHPDPRALRTRPVLLEDAPDEGSLAGRVEVVRANRDRRLGRRT